MAIREDILHHIWKYRLFTRPLIDLDEQEVVLIDTGLHNRDSGPDFFNARIYSEGILWAGNVEIHRMASDWYQHGHHLDPAFDNVILHVVTNPDCQACNSRGREIRTVKMEIAPEIRRQCELLLEAPDFIPCWRSLHNIDPVRICIWMERLIVERLENRVSQIRSWLGEVAGDWDEVLYRALARGFGQNTNADPFEILARLVPRKQIMKNCPSLISKEALLFGQAGMLSGNYECPYFRKLQDHYGFLQRKMGLESMDGFLWKYLRLRPDNFPTIRIAQLACSLDKYPDLMGELIECDDPVDFVMKMEIKASEYWTSHYRFGRVSPAREKNIGQNRLIGLLINAILPVLFAYRKLDSKRVDMPGMDPGQDLADVLHRIPAEDNRIIRMWKGLGLDVPDGFSSQALLQLTKKYCRTRSCLSCYIGSRIIQDHLRR